jgi:hypothetical protein
LASPRDFDYSARVRPLISAILAVLGLSTWSESDALAAPPARRNPKEFATRDPDDGPAADGPRDGPWALELILAAEPSQAKNPHCNRDVDCLTRAKAYFGGAIRGRFATPDVSLGTTLGLTELMDQEGLPSGGYRALTLRVDLQIELGRRADRFGAALRISPTLVHAWAATGHATQSDIPGFGLVLGTTRLWGEVGLPTLPTPFDPRLFHLAMGFVVDRWSGTAGFGSFGTLGYAHNTTDKASTSFGVYGDVTMRVTDRFDLRIQAIVTSPFMVSLGFGWRFPE